MKSSFFEKELFKIRERFNQTFGRQIVCDLKTRQQVILSIIHMGLLSRKISETGVANETRARIQRLIKVRDTLNGIFDKAEDTWAERRNYGNKSNHVNRQKWTNRSKGNDQEVSDLRKSIRTGLAAERR